jgi:hypothetical protein
LVFIFYLSFVYLHIKKEKKEKKKKREANLSLNLWNLLLTSRFKKQRKKGQEIYRRITPNTSLTKEEMFQFHILLIVCLFPYKIMSKSTIEFIGPTSRIFFFFFEKKIVILIHNQICKENKQSPCNTSQEQKIKKKPTFPSLLVEYRQQQEPTTKATQVAAPPRFFESGKTTG